MAEFTLTELYEPILGRAPFPGGLRQINSLSDLSLIWRRQKTRDGVQPIAPEIDSRTLSDLEISDFKFTLPPVISIANRLNVVETVISGQAGTVKEVTSVQDYKLNIRGFLTEATFQQTNGDFTLQTRQGEFPETQLLNLRNLFESGQSQPVNSYFLSIFNITDVLIMDLRINESTGFEGVIAFEFSAVSDKNPDLILL